jgi:hypothetical protein
MRLIFWGVTNYFIRFRNIFRVEEGRFECSVQTHRIGQKNLARKSGVATIVAHALCLKQLYNNVRVKITVQS